MNNISSVYQDNYEFSLEQQTTTFKYLFDELIIVHERTSELMRYEQKYSKSYRLKLAELGKMQQSIASQIKKLSYFDIIKEKLSVEYMNITEILQGNYRSSYQYH